MQPVRFAVVLAAALGVACEPPSRHSLPTPFSPLWAPRPFPRRASRSGRSWSTGCGVRSCSARSSRVSWLRVVLKTWWAGPLGRPDIGQSGRCVQPAPEGACGPAARGEQRPRRAPGSERGKTRVGGGLGRDRHVVRCGRAVRDAGEPSRAQGGHQRLRRASPHGRALHGSAGPRFEPDRHVRRRDQRFPSARVVPRPVRGDHLGALAGQHVQGCAVPPPSHRDRGLAARGADWSAV